PPPRQGFRVIGVLLQRLINGLHRASECRLVAAEGAEHVVADPIIEPLLGNARGGDAECDDRCKAEGAAPSHGRPPLGCWPRRAATFSVSQSTLDIKRKKSSQSDTQVWRRRA